MKKLIAIGCLALFFASCEKVIDPGELPDQEARLVINTVLDKDSVITVNLSQSKSIVSGKDYKTVDKQTVYVFEDGVFFEQLAFVAKGKYMGTKKPGVGKTYRVIARASGFTDAEGSTRMPPESVLISCERLDSATTFPSISTGFSTKSISIFGGLNYKIQLKDNSDINDYYNISIRWIAIDSAGVDFVDLGILYLNDLSNTQSSSTSSFYYNGLYGTDKETVIAGNKVFRVGTYLYSPDLELKRPITLQPILYCTQFSEEYYKFMQTASKQISTGASFFAEPTVIYSNCSNGMGVVGGRTTSIKLLNPVIVK